MPHSKTRTLTELASSSDPRLLAAFFRKSSEHLTKLNRLLHLTPVNTDQYQDIRRTIHNIKELTSNTRERLRPKKPGDKESGF